MVTLDLGSWFRRVQVAKKRSEIFAILDEFRPLPWSDEERAQMARLYIRLIDTLPDEGDVVTTSSAPDTKPANDGPVWYEKM